MNCVYCKKEKADVIVVDKSDGTTTPFCDWTCLVGYVKERGLLMRDDFPPEGC